MLIEIIAATDTSFLAWSVWDRMRLELIGAILGRHEGSALQAALVRHR
jgi:hypothetical protein